MADEHDSVLPEPTDPPITFDGEPITATRLVEIFERNFERNKPAVDAARRARDFRRKTLRTEIAKSWADKNPEAAKNAVSLHPQRSSLEKDVKSRSGSVEPRFVCEPLPPGRQTDYDNAAAKERYLEEWRKSEFGSPFRTFLGKGIEDGPYGRVRWPSDFSMRGRPDFFDRLTDKAYAALKPDEQKAYKRDDADRRRRYTRMDDKGKPVPAAKWDRDADGKPRPAVEDKKKPFKRDEEKSSKAHDIALQRYLLQKPASVGRLLSVLDCAPIWTEGYGRERFKLIGLIERRLVSREEAIRANYGWHGMGDRAFVPGGSEKDGTAEGKDGQWYLYTFYLCDEDEDGIERPLMLYCIGGRGTYDTRGGYGAGTEGDPKSVAMIDLYKEYGIEGPLWSWHGGSSTEDDDPAYRWRPYMDPLIDLILGLEGVDTAIRATTHVNSFTGYQEQPDAKLVELDPEALIESGPGAKQLRKPKIPKPGEIERSIGPIEPFHQATIGQDAWRLSASDRQTLLEATAVDQASPASGSSGHAMVVGETLAKIGKQENRDGALDAVVADGIAHLKILDAIARKHGIRWPQQTVEKPAANAPAKSKPRYEVVEFDPEWVEGGHWALKAEYPSEENIAKVDQEFTLWQGNASTLKNVLLAKGVEDTDSAILEIMEDMLKKSPAYIQRVQMALAAQTGDKDLEAIVLAMQEQGDLTQPMPGVPGGQTGLPATFFKGPGQGGPSRGSQVRAGVISGEKGSASRMADAEAQIAVGGAAA